MPVLELYTIANDIAVIGIRVSSFPDGIKEAFNSLGKKLGTDRAYYGLSWMDENDSVQYYAMAEEAFPGEGKQHGLEQLTIKKGNYQTEAIHNWRSQLACIKDVFHEMMGNNKPGKDRPCIEWYRSDAEMLCMIRIA